MPKIIYPKFFSILFLLSLVCSFQQLMAEISDVRRFSHKGALVAYAGVDAPPYQSDTFYAKNRHVSKRGSPHLRKVLFEIVSMILVHGNPENSAFCFMDKKRAEGKHFYVYTVAGSAKFLRIYYARAKEYLNAQETAQICCKYETPKL